MVKGGEKTTKLAETQRERDPLTQEEKALAARALSAPLYGAAHGRPLSLDTARALGAKDSAHDVFFIRTARKDENGQRTSFACKRFRRLDSAQQELQAMKTAQARGFHTLQPVEQGIYGVSGIGHILVTHHMPRFTTMNYLGWRDTYAGQVEYDRRIGRPLQRIGRFAAQMHSKGILHGDFQVKNVAQDGMGDFVLFDLEDATFQDDINDVGYVSRAGEDLSVFLTSLVSRGYLWNSTDATFKQEITANLFDPYVNTMTIENPLVLDYAQQAMNEALTLRPRLHGDFSSRMGLPS